MKTSLHMIGLFLLVFAFHSAHSETPNQKLLKPVKRKTKKIEKLRLRSFDVLKQATGKVDLEPKQLKANRVYSVWVEKHKEWMLTHTDRYSKVAQPLKVIRVKTVLPASFFGVNKSGNYLYTDDKAWTRTFKPDFRYYWVFDEPEYILTEAFKPPKRKVTRAQMIRHLASIFKKLDKPKEQPKPLLVDYLMRPVRGKEGLPERVYYRYIPEIGNWYFSITDDEGNFEKPMELLLPGSVLQGPYFQLPKSESRELVKGDNWLPVKRWARRKTIVLSEPPHVHYVTYVTPRVGAHPVK